MCHGPGSAAGRWEETGMVLQNVLYYQFHRVLFWFFAIFQSLSCLLEKWEEMNLEYERSQINSSACQNLSLVQRTSTA